MRTLAIWILSQHRQTLWRTLRHAAITVSIAAAIGFLVTMWPAYWFYHTAAWERPPWSVWLSGPITEQDMADIRSAAASDVDAKLVPFDTGAFLVTTADGERRTRCTAFRYRTADVRDLEYTLFRHAMVLDGAMTPAAWGIDWATARRLGVGVGDRLRFTETLTTGDATRPFAREGTIGAIFLPSSTLSGIVLPMTEEEQESAANNGYFCTELFIRTRMDASRLAERLQQLPHAVAPGWTVLTSEQQTLGASEGALIAGDQTRSAMRAFLVAASILYAVYAFREQQTRIGGRRRSIATLVSLGLRSRSIAAALAVEQLVLLGLPTLLGALIGINLNWWFGGFYVPQPIMLRGLAGAIALNAVVFAVTAGAIVRRIRQLPVSQLLASSS